MKKSRAPSAASRWSAPRSKFIACLPENGPDLSARGSGGRPSTRSPRMLRSTWSVPPAIAMPGQVAPGCAARCRRRRRSPRRPRRRRAAARPASATSRAAAGAGELAGAGLRPGQPALAEHGEAAGSRCSGWPSSSTTARPTAWRASTCRSLGRASAAGRGRARRGSRPATPMSPPAPPIATRSFISVVSATRQPSPGSPSRSLSGMRTSSKNTSLKPDPPPIWRSGRTVTPGACMSTTNIVRPGVLGPVRVGAGEQDAVVGDVRERRPDLLAVDHPVVAVADGAWCAAPARSRARRRLAEQLAPDVVGAQQPGEVALLLVVAAVAITVGPHMPMPMWLISVGIRARAQLLRRRSPAAPACRPGRRARGATGCRSDRPRRAPAAVARNSAWWVAGSIDSPGATCSSSPACCVEQAAHVRPVLGFLGTVVEVHGCTSRRAFGDPPQRDTGHP